MLFSACNVGNGGEVTTSGAESVVEESRIPAQSEKKEESEPEGGSETDDGFSREKVSRSREELEAMITLSDKDFTEAYEMLAAFKEIAVKSDDEDAVDEVYLPFEEKYYYLETQITVAMIVYYCNMSDDDASARYLDNYELFGDLHNEYIEVCKAVYNSSPIRDALFADWTEEEINEMLNYNPETIELSLKNEELTHELNDLPDDEFYDRAAEIYVEIVTNNNRLAELCGYDNYYDYAAKEVYNRDYTREDLETFSELVKTYIIPNYKEISGKWEGLYAALPTVSVNDVYYYLYGEFDTLPTNYLLSYMDSCIESTKAGLYHVFDNRNVIFAESRNSHQSAFQTYLRTFEHPFCLFGNSAQDTSTLAHEMGHYYASLYNADINSLDLAEVQSQANEMLLLKHLESVMPARVYEVIKNYKLYMCVLEMTVSVIIDEFERAVYDLESVEGFKSADFDAIMDKVCAEYGNFTTLEQNIMDINEYWRLTATNSPVYYISYATSLTEALNVFAEAELDYDNAKEIYRIIIEEVSEDEKFRDAAAMAGLTDPFDKKTFESIIAMILN
jgi:hypothetical protein